MTYVPPLADLAFDGRPVRDPLPTQPPAPAFARDRSVTVGKTGRALFSRLHLWRRAPQPRLERLYWHLLKPLAAAALILWYTPRYALAVKRRYGVPVAEQLAQQVRLGFRDRVNPRTYYFHEHYRRRGPVDCSAYVMRHEIKEGLLKSLHKLQPKTYGARINLGHKLDFATVCERHGLPTPAILAIAARGRLSLRPAGLLDGDLFLKPEVGRGARGAMAFRRARAGDYVFGRADAISREALLALVARRSWRRPQILQPMLVNHADLANLAEQALVTFRIFTCLTPQRRPVVTHAMLRTLAKLEPDWPTGEEFAAAVDIATGRLSPMCSDAVFGPDAWYDFHPVTCARVTGRMVPQWSAIRELAVRAHRVFNDRTLIGWDIALTPEGPVLIEANSYPDTEFLQRVHRQGIGESPLGPLLAHWLDELTALDGRFRSS